MKTFESLSSAEKDALLKLPAYVSLLAANADAGLDEQEKKEAMELTHIKSYAAHPTVRGFYKEAEKVFDKNIEELNHELPHNKKEREAAINNQLKKISEVINSLDEEYAATLYQSIRSYKEYVSKAHRNILEYFLFPYPLKGITD